MKNIPALKGGKMKSKLKIAFLFILGSIALIKTMEKPLTEGALKKKSELEGLEPDIKKDLNNVTYGGSHPARPSSHLKYFLRHYKKTTFFNPLEQNEKLSDVVIELLLHMIVGRKLEGHFKTITMDELMKLRELLTEKRKEYDKELDENLSILLAKELAASE